MTEAWKQWEGHVVDGRFALKHFLGKSDHSAVFQTTYGNYAQAAALKLVESNPATVQAQLARWEKVAKLEHRHLLRVLHWGRCQLGAAPMLLCSKRWMIGFRRIAAGRSDLTRRRGRLKASSQFRVGKNCTCV